VGLGRNSLQYSFLDAATKSRLLADYDRRVATFEAKFAGQGWDSLKDVRPETYGFICRRYRICLR
jgi:adenosine deaminase CECR1